MPVTTGALLKAYLETQGLGYAVYADQPIPQPRRPYVVALDEMSMVPDPWEDGKANTVVETVQLDLYQDWRDLDGRVTGRKGKLLVDWTLSPHLTAVLDGSRLYLPGNPDVPGKVGQGIVYVVKVASIMRRIFDTDNIHDHTYTLEVRRGQ